MTDKNISRERWQALYGSAPESFQAHVQSTLKKTREEPNVKRFTVRTVILVVLILMLLTGIALAAAGMFGTLDYLHINTSAPLDGAGVIVQNQIEQTGGDFPDLTATVRDAVYDGAMAYVTVEYKLKDPKKYMLLSDRDTLGLDLSAVKKRYGEGGGPLTDPVGDPREKLVLGGEKVYVYGVNAAEGSIRVYEEGGVVVLTFRIQLFGSSLKLPGLNSSEGPWYSWLPSAYQVQEWEPDEKSPAEQDIGYGPTDVKEMNHRLADAKEHLASGEPLDIKIKVPLLTWNGDVNGDQYSKYSGKYYCNVSLRVKKTGDKKEYIATEPIQQEMITLKSARFIFTDLATYGEIITDYSLAVSAADENKPGHKLVYEIVDDQGNIISPLSYNSSGEYGEILWWPAMKEVPSSVTIRVKHNYREKILATFDIPLEAVPVSTETAPRTDH